MKSAIAAGRGRRLPATCRRDRAPGASSQDHVNANLLFVGHGVRRVVHASTAGSTGCSSRAGSRRPRRAISPFSKREGDLVVGTFGRGVFILDDYSALRDVTPQALAEQARLFPLRDAYLYNELKQVEAAWGNVATPNPPYGALFTYSLGQPPAAGSKLVLNIADDTGKQLRRIELASTPGVHRVAWDLRTDPPPPAGQ